MESRFVPALALRGDQHADAVHGYIAGWSQAYDAWLQDQAQSQQVCSSYAYWPASKEVTERSKLYAKLNWYREHDPEFYRVLVRDIKQSQRGYGYLMRVADNALNPAHDGLGTFNDFVPVFMVGVSQPRAVAQFYDPFPNGVNGGALSARAPRGGVEFGPRSVGAAQAPKYIPGYGYKDAKYWKIVKQLQMGESVQAKNLRMAAELRCDAFPGLVRNRYRGPLSDAPDLRGTYDWHNPQRMIHPGPHQTPHIQIKLQDSTIIRIEVPQ